MDGSNGFTAQRVIGAMGLPTMMALWALGFLVVQELRGEALPATGASSERPMLAWATPPAAPPALDSRAFLNDVGARSDVLRGEWQPARRRAVVREPVVVREPAVVHAPAVVHEALAPREPLAAGAPIAVHDVTSSAPPLPAASIRAQATFAGPDPKLAARVAISLGDDEGAYRLLSAELPDVRDDRERYDLLAAVAMRIGRYVEAADIYRALLALDGSDPRLWAGFALAQEQLGQREAVAFGYRKLLMTAAAGSPLHRLALERLSRFG